MEKNKIYKIDEIYIGCYNKNEVLEVTNGVTEMNTLDILSLENLPLKDKFWFVVQNCGLSVTEKQILSLSCIKIVFSVYERSYHSDKIVSDCIDVIEKVMNGELDCYKSYISYMNVINYSFSVKDTFCNNIAVSVAYLSYSVFLSNSAIKSAEFSAYSSSVIKSDIQSAKNAAFSSFVAFLNDSSYECSNSILHSVCVSTSSDDEKEKISKQLLDLLLNIFS